MAGKAAKLRTHSYHSASRVEESIIKYSWNYLMRQTKYQNIYSNFRVSGSGEQLIVSRCRVRSGGPEVKRWTW